MSLPAKHNTVHTAWHLCRYLKKSQSGFGGTEVIGALKWFFHIRRPREPRTDLDNTGTLDVFEEDELVGVHWEGSVKLFMKVPIDSDLMQLTYADEGKHAVCFAAKPKDSVWRVTICCDVCLVPAIRQEARQAWGMSGHSYCVFGSFQCVNGCVCV